MAVRKLEVLITGNARGARKALGDLERTASTKGKGTTKALSGIRQELLGLGAGAAAWGAFKAFEDSERIARQTEAVIKSTGGVANVTAKDIEGLADEMSKLGGTDDELVAQGANMLATFTDVRNEVGKGNDIFNQATLAANNYAAATGGDVVDANKMLGKALNDPIRGLTALTKAGVVFDSQQRDQIRTMVESGDKMGAQKIILAEFAKEYGGSLEANATTSGKARVAIDNLAESVGEILAPALGTAASAAAGAAEAFSGLPKWAQTGTVGVAALGTAAIVAGPKILSMYRSIKGGLGAARTFATTMSDALGAIADTRGVSKGRAAIEAGKASVVESTSAHKKLGTALAGIGFAGAIAGAAAWGHELSKTTVDIEGALTATDEEARKAVEGLTATGKAAEFFAKAGEGDIRILYQMRDAVGSNIDKYPELTEAIETAEARLQNKANTESEYAGAVEIATTAVDEQKEATDRATQSNYDSEASIAAARDRYAELETEADAATQAIQDYYDASTNVVGSQIDAERALDDVAQSIRDNGLALSIRGPGGQANRQAMADAKDDIVAYALAVREQTGSSDAAAEAMNTYVLRLQETMLNAGFTRDQVLALTDELGIVPSDNEILFSSNATEEELKVKAIKASIENLPGWGDTPATIRLEADTSKAQASILTLASQVNELTGNSATTGLAGMAIAIHNSQNAPATPGSGTPKKKGSIPTFHDGGIVPGPVGSDQLILAQGGERVSSLSEMRSGGGGGNVYLTVYVQGNVRPDRDLIDGIVTAVNQGTRMSGRSPFTTTMSSVRR